MGDLSLNLNKESTTRQTVFTWPKEAIEMLLEVYESNIDSFLNPSFVQVTLWRKLSATLIQKLPAEYKYKINSQRAFSKFASLKNRFKQEFFKAEKDRCSVKLFPYYEKMNQMFTDYAMRKLNETNHDSLDMNTSEFLVTSLIGDILESGKFSGANNENSATKSDTGHSHDTSEASKIKTKLAELPKRHVYVSNAEKMRIDPNTPFNRHISHTSLLNQRNSFMNSYQGTAGMKRRLVNDPEFQSKRPQKVPKINSTEVDFVNEDVYIIEALEECELSTIPIRQSKVLYHDENSTNLRSSINFEETSSKQVSTSKQASRPSVVKVSHKAYSGSLNLSKNEKFRLQDQTEETLTSSVVIPSFHLTSDYESDLSSVDILRNIPHATDLNQTPNIVLPKKLNLLQEVQNFSSLTNRCLIEKLQQNKEISIIKKPAIINEQPIWFKEFLMKYERDMKSINSKLESIINASM